MYVAVKDEKRILQAETRVLNNAKEERIHCRQQTTKRFSRSIHFDRRFALVGSEVDDLM